MRLVLLAFTWVAILAPAASAQEAGVDEADPTTLFFEGLDMVEAGDCTGAIARFEMAVARDPELHQARLYTAECFETLGLHDRALEEAEAYLSAQFPGAQVDRARGLVDRLRERRSTGTESEPESEPVCRTTESESEPMCRTTETETGTETEPMGGTAVVESSIPSGDGAGRGVWAGVRIEGGASMLHVANAVPLTAGGPLVELRVLPWRYLEIGARAGVAFGAYPGEEGAILVPELALSAGASIPVGRMRIVAGVSVPLVLSRYGGSAGVVAGVRGEGGVRFAPPGSRLVLGAQIEGGYLARPTVGGSIRVGVQLGREERTDVR